MKQNKDVSNEEVVVKMANEYYTHHNNLNINNWEFWLIKRKKCIH